MDSRKFQKMCNISCGRAPDVWHDISSSSVLFSYVCGASTFFIAHNIAYLIIVSIALVHPTNTKANANTGSETWS